MLTRMVSISRPHDPPALASQSAGITSLSHWAWPKSFYYKDKHTYVYCSTVHNSKDFEPTQMPMIDRFDKENVAQIYHETLNSHKKDELMSFAGTWMKLETIFLANWHKNRKPNMACSHSEVGFEQWEHMDTGKGTSHTRACRGVGC